jgi:hypothetical protein
MKSKLLAIIAIAVLSVGLSLGTPAYADIDMTIDEISGEYAECTAYYQLVQDAVVASAGDKETADTYGKLKDSVMFYSLLLANEGRTKDMAVQVTHSRIEIYKKVMLKEIGNRYENFSILINKHNFECQDLVSNPPDQLKEAMTKRIENLDSGTGIEQ